MASLPSAPPEEENKYHTYISNRIPWYVAVFWIFYWIPAIFWTARDMIPAAVDEIRPRIRGDRAVVTSPVDADAESNVGEPAVSPEQ